MRLDQCIVISAICLGASIAGAHAAGSAPQPPMPPVAAAEPSRDFHEEFLRAQEAKNDDVLQDAMRAKLTEAGYDGPSFGFQRHDSDCAAVECTDEYDAGNSVYVCSIHIWYDRPQREPFVYSVKSVWRPLCFHRPKD